jgi:acyl-CoA thioester hydrolase
VTADERLAHWGTPLASGGPTRPKDRGSASSPGFVAPVHVRWSDIDMYQHINHATMVTILEEARIPFLREPFESVIEEIGLLIHEVKILYKGQLRLIDTPLQVTMWSKRVRAVDFTIGYEVRSVRRAPDSKPSVIAETQLAAVHIKEQRLERLSSAQREYLQRYLR